MAKKKPKKIKSAVLIAAEAELKSRRDAISAERNKLQNMIDDLTELEDSCADAIQGIEAAIDALSRYA